MPSSETTSVEDFYPRPPRGGRLQPVFQGENCCLNFYPRPPRGGRREGKLTAYTRGEFLSTPSARRATSIRSMCCSPGAYFYPRPPRGGRPPVGTRKAACHELFLSTPSARRTTVSVSPEAAVLPNFYPRPPRGGRQYLYRSYHTLGGFLSTPSARRATPTATTSLNSRKNFYPRPPRGGRPVVVLQHVGFHQFLSTPSARRATLKTTITTNVGGISIHALREEGDRRAFLQGRLPVYFYPRPPRGGRPVMQDGLTRYVKFLSTPSARRATPRGKQATESTAISIHALREEGDVMQSFTKKYCFQFLSTPSARRATFKPEQSSVLQGLFLSTPSARRATGGSYLFLG